MTKWFQLIDVLQSGKMARGQQKLQSQAKAAEKTAKAKKQQGHNALDQKKAAQKALVHACVICKVIAYTSRCRSNKLSRRLGPVEREGEFYHVK